MCARRAGPFRAQCACRAASLSLIRDSILGSIIAVQSGKLLHPRAVPRLAVAPVCSRADWLRRVRHRPKQRIPSEHIRQLGRTRWSTRARALHQLCGIPIFIGIPVAAGLPGRSYAHNGQPGGVSISRLGGGHGNRLPTRRLRVRRQSEARAFRWPVPTLTERRPEPDRSVGNRRFGDCPCRRSRVRARHERACAANISRAWWAPPPSARRSRRRQSACGARAASARRFEYDVEGAPRGFEVASTHVESRRDRQHRGSCGCPRAVQRRPHRGVEGR
jgi:hypothetical protein